MKQPTSHAVALQTLSAAQAVPSARGVHAVLEEVGLQRRHGFVESIVSAAYTVPSIRHTGLQTPEAQRSLAAQRWSQVPQLRSSLSVSTHAPPQAITPASPEQPGLSVTTSTEAS